MSNERRLGALLGLLLQPLAFDARDLHGGRADWLRERSGVEQEESGSAAAGEQDDRRVAAPPRFRERGLPFERIHERNRHGFCQPDLSIATERSEPTAHSFAVGEGSVE